MTTFTKLRSGAWGARVEGARPVEGQAISIEKRGGATVRKTVARVVWSAPGGQLHLVALADDARGASGSLRRAAVQRRSGRCEDAPCCGHEECGYREGRSAFGYGY